MPGFFLFTLAMRREFFRPVFLLDVILPHLKHRRAENSTRPERRLRFFPNQRFQPIAFHDAAHFGYFVGARRVTLFRCAKKCAVA
jgi:hypothetical protein